MIENDDQLKQNLEVIAGMYRALADLHNRFARVNFGNYQIFAEGPVEEIRRAQREINEYLGLAEQFAAPEELDTASTVIEPPANPLLPGNAPATHGH
jgi:hypothetical protein